MIDMRAKRKRYGGDPLPSANWDAGILTSRAFGGVPSLSGPNTMNAGQIRTVLGRVRAAARNAPIAKRCIDLQVTNLIGTGIMPRFRDPSLQAIWLEWEDVCDADGIRDIYALQSDAVRAWQEGGEGFVRARPRRMDDNLPIPLQLELLEPEMLPYEDWMQGERHVVQGIELNAINKPGTYWFYRDHPGEYILSGMLSNFSKTPVSVNQVAHLFDPAQAGQLRGFPPMATVLQKLQMMKDFNEATLERYKLSAALTFIFTRMGLTESDKGIDPFTGEDITESQRGQFELPAGSAYQLLPGESVHTPDLPSVGGDFAAFVKANYIEVAAGYGVPYEMLTGDYNNISDRTLRVVMDEYRRHVTRMQWHRVVPMLMLKIKRWFIDAAILAGRVPVNVDRHCEWVPPAWPYFHPVQDVAALEHEIKLGLRSHSEVVNSRGNDPKTVREQRRQDMAEERASGLYSTGFNWDTSNV